MSTLFETSRLLIRRVTPDDVDELCSIFGDADNVWAYGTGLPWSRADVEQFIAGYPASDPRLISAPGLALLKQSGAVTGFGGVGYYLEEGNSADLLYIFKHAYWGKGLATELAQAALATAFGRSEIDLIHATVKPSNVASVRVLEKSGMRLEQYLPDVDRLHYVLDRDAWLASRATA